MRSRKFIFIAIIVLSALFSYANWPTAPLPSEDKIDHILVEKADRKMHVLSKGKVLKIYRIALGSSPKGHKQQEGDGRTPEGIYVIESKNPQSGYHLNLGISYPDRVDQKNAERAGVSPGGEIKIHGLRNGTGMVGRLHRLSDWTLGCIAVTNEEIQELYDHVAIGTVIEIKE